MADTHVHSLPINAREAPQHPIPLQPHAYVNPNTWQIVLRSDTRVVLFHPYSNTLHLSHIPFPSPHRLALPLADSSSVDSQLSVTTVCCLCPTCHQPLPPGHPPLPEREETDSATPNPP